MTVDDFINQTNGIQVDEDGYYGAQCWDLVAKYARVVVGCPSFPTGSGGAEGLYRLFQDPIPQYFDRIANDPNNSNQLPQKGDVIVWMASFSPPYGHTALVISADASGPTVLEQNGNNPGGVAYIKKRSWVGVSGWLRPKKGPQMNPTEGDVNNIVGALWGIPANANNVRDFTSLSWHDFIYAVLAAYPFQDRMNAAADAVSKLPGLTKQVADLTSQNTSLQGQITDLTGKLNDLNTKVDELVKTNDLKDKRIADLQKQVPDSTTVEQPVVTPDKRSLWQVIGDFLSQFKKG